MTLSKSFKTMTEMLKVNLTSFHGHFSSISVNSLIRPCPSRALFKIYGIPMK